MPRDNGSSLNRNLSVADRVDIAEGEAEDSDSAGSDLMGRDGRGQVSFEEYYGSLVVDSNNVAVSSSGTEGSNGAKKRKRLTYGKEKGERIAFDDDGNSDDAYTNFKKRKGVQRKATLASTRRAKAQTGKNSVVGKRSKSSIAASNGVRKGGDKPNALDSDDEDEALMETTLPEYLQQWRNGWEKRRTRLGDAGLRIPPDYDDIEFSGDERLDTLEERPKLPAAAPSGEYKDIELKRSAGVIPASIAQYLREYQVHGASFLHEHFVHQRGGILGDDMGLGKTIQVIAFLTAAFGKSGDERDEKRMRKMRRAGDDKWYPRILIICPGTLMSNWQSELERWGWWQVYVYHGPSSIREAAMAAAHKGRLEIMITTYTTYRLSESAINGVRWDCVIADECHQIKERKAEITKSMNNLNALCRIGLTGTAIQNKYEELWTLLNWANPGQLGPISVWKQTICIPLKLGQSHDATFAQIAKSRLTAQRLAKNLLPRYFLRRMKSLIAQQLPKKSDQIVFCPPTEIQTEGYNNFCDSELLQTIRNAHLICTCRDGRRLGRKQGWCCFKFYQGVKWQNFVFPCLITLQKLANHVALLIPSGESDPDRHDKEVDKLKMAMPHLWEELYRDRDKIMSYANVKFCGKWKVLRKMLSYWYDNGDKVLIFSHSVRLLKMLRMLFQTGTSYNVSYLDGGMSYEDRQKVVDEYNSDPKQFVFLISTKAGGVGLNITSANKVVVVDPNWNPAHDLQAQDRAYRIGQARDVEVFRLVTVGSVEEIVYARQIYKQQQANIGYNASVERRYFRGVQDQKDMKGEIFGLGNLFAPLSENARLQDIVNKTNIAETKAGVEIAGLDLEASQEDDEGMQPPTEDSKEDAAMSQLAAEIIDEPAAKRKATQKSAKARDPVQAILASVGVEYTHENAEVIGTSRIEGLLSSRAKKVDGNIALDTHRAFGQDPGDGDQDGQIADDEMDGADGKIKYKYNPPADVQRRQFCTMAKQYGYDDVTEFALVVEGWTQGQRRNCLDKFYQDRRAKLGVESLK